MTLDKPRLSWMACELLVATKFADRGFGVSFPLWPQPYDLIVDKAGQLLRIQVRLSRQVPQRQRRLGKGDRAHDRVDLMKRYPRVRIALGTFDYLAAVCDAERIYLIPVRQLRSQDRPELLCRSVVIKEPLPLAGRRDSARAGLRWAPYKNAFDLAVE